MVFQDYALFPHLDVAGNVAYGLGRAARREAGARGARDSSASAASATATRTSSPAASSSGSRWRGRSSPAPEPILLDEPFSNLDAGLRAKVRDEVREILEPQGVTAVFVTHDQEEALSVADIVAVVNEGRVEQVGTPEEVYSRPATRWVAGFLGEIEVLPGTAANGTRRAASWAAAESRGLAGEVDVLIRPESLAIGTVEPPDRRSRRRRSSRAASTATTSCSSCELPSGRTVRARRLGFPAWHPGDRVRVWIEGPADVLPAAE